LLQKAPLFATTQAMHLHVLTFTAETIMSGEFLVRQNE
jgi:hypothetical protein